MRRFGLLIGFSAAAILSALALPSLSCADDLNFRSEFNYLNSNSKINQKAAAEVLSTDFSAFIQRYNLNFSKTLYPYLSAAGGADYETDKSTSSSQNIQIDTELKTLRPFVRLDLNNPIYKAGIGYNRTQRENRTTGTPTSQDIRDEISAVAGWDPVDLPAINLRYLQTHTYNDPQTIDATDKQLTFDTRYTAWKKLLFNYFYVRSDKENTLRGFNTLEQNHNARVDYSQDFFDRRLFLSTGYRFRYRTFQFPGTASADIALTRNFGLYSLDDTPQDGPALGPIPGLIDGNLSVPTIVNLGLNGDETTLTNTGLGFVAPVEVSKLYVWIHRRPSAAVANYFSWAVYTSPDNTDDSTWSPVAGVSALFGDFDNRFEISFPAVNTRYIKVVTRSLVPGPAVPDAAEYPDIFVTEMQAFTTVSGIAVQNENISINHNYNLNLRGRLGKQTNLSASLYYSLQEEDPLAQKTTLLSNDVSLSHVFNRVFSASARVSRSEDQSPDDTTVTYTYGTAIRGSYLETLNQTLTYSATKTTEAEGSSDRNSIMLRTNATLYRAWSAFLDTGYSWDKPPDSSQNSSTIIRAGTNVVPNRKVNISLNCELKRTRQPDNAVPETSRTQWNLQALITPFRALSFNIEYNVIDERNSRTSLQQLSANWSPFPDGALQLFLTYNETLRPESDLKDRTIGPSLKWTISRHASLEMTYNFFQSENPSYTTDTKSFTSKLRLVF